MQRPPVRLAGQQTIGRAEDCTVILDHPTVSKHHATVRWDGAVFVLDDSKSRNGSSVNGRRVTTPTPLHDGDTVILGEVVFRFRLGAA
jgi:pSer/pThr/pTyr-binding forkhead associated (FHA) protein